MRQEELRRVPTAILLIGVSLTVISTLLVSSHAGAALTKTSEAKQFSSDINRYSATWNNFGSDVISWSNKTSDREMTSQATASRNSLAVLARTLKAQQWAPAVSKDVAALENAMTPALTDFKNLASLKPSGHDAWINRFVQDCTTLFNRADVVSRAVGLGGLTFP